MKKINLDYANAGAAVKTANRFGATPLSLACSNGSAAMIGKLLSAGADPNARQQGDFRPIDEAVHTDNAALIALLRERGADD